MSTSACKRTEQRTPDLPKGWEELVKIAQDVATAMGENYFFEEQQSTFQSPMFAFVRRLQKAMIFSTAFWNRPERIADIIEQGSAYRFEQYMNRLPNETFWESYLPYTGGKDEFVAVWLTMRFPAYATPLELAAEDGKKLPLQLANPHGEAYSKILSLAGHLQQRVGSEQEIALPQEMIGKVLNIPQRTVSMFLQLAEREKFLTKTTKHNHLNKKAALFRFDIERFDWTTGKEIIAE